MPTHLLPPWWRPFLFFQPLLQLLQDLVEAAQRLDELLLLVGQVLLGELAQPLLGDLRQQRIAGAVETLEDMAEDAVEAVEVALVLHQRGAREK